jgi:hypothetical protein
VTKPGEIEADCERCDVEVRWDPASGEPAPQCTGCGAVLCARHLEPHVAECGGTT